MRSLPRRDLGSISHDLGALWGSVRRSVKVEFGEGDNAESGASVSSVSSIGFVRWMGDRADRAKFR